jgi:hypothetical protein
MARCDHDEPTGTHLEETTTVQIHLNYTTRTSETDSNNPYLPRVPKVPQELDRLAFQGANCEDDQQQQKRLSRPPSEPQRKPTFNLYDSASDEESDVESREQKREEIQPTKREKIQPTAIMSSEKASNPKDKLEGTYQGRVRAHPFSSATRRSTR